MGVDRAANGSGVSESFRRAASGREIRFMATLRRTIKGFIFFVFDGLSPLFIKEKTIHKDAVENILVAGCGGIGDLFRLFPALEALHENFPSAAISVLLYPGIRDALSLFEGQNLISEIIEYDPSGRQRSFLKKLSMILRLRNKRFDLIYSPDRGHGMQENIFMNFLIGSRYRLGFRKGRAGSLNSNTVQFRDDIPISEQNLAILEAAHLTVRTKEIRLKIPEHELLSAKRTLSENGFADVYPLITIHPGVKWKSPYRCLPVEKYIALIKTAIDRLNARTILIGSADEASIGDTISKKLPYPHVLNLIGKTTISGMAAMIQQSHVFIGNDSGPLHIAVAMKKPAVAIFGATSPSQVLSSREKCIVVRKKDPALPLYLHQPDYQFGSVTGYWDSLTVEDIMTGVQSALQQ
jgi:ADP-heptose:LPS heptosyltransferase